MRSTCGWREGVLTSRSSATRMTPFVIARALRRRRCYERACRPLCGLQAGAASREDEDRLLQGCEPTRRLPYHLVRLSGIPVSGPEDDVEGRHEAYLRAQLPTRRQPEGVDVH